MEKQKFEIKPIQDTSLLSDFIGWVVFALIIFNTLGFIAGLVNGATHTPGFGPRCGKTPRRIHYVVPAYLFGCWLTEEI